MAIALLNVGDQFTAAIEQQIAAAINGIAQQAKFSGGSSALQSIPTGTITALTLNTETVDTAGGHSTSTLNTRYTVQSGFAGCYLVVVRVGYAANATGRRTAGVSVNGTGLQIAQTSVVGTAAGVTIVNSTYLTDSLNVGDYIEGHALQDSGAALNTLAGAVSVQCIYMGT